MREPMLPVPGLQLEMQVQGVLHRMLLWGEARGERDADGRLESLAMAAVAWVPLNRAKRVRWATLSLGQIILQPWQFSCFNHNDPNRMKMLDAPKIDPASWERADTVCDLIESGVLTDPTRGATHYCTTKLWNREVQEVTRPQWFERHEVASGRTRETVTIGSHVFAVAP